MRMPLEESLVAYENLHFSLFFDGIKQIAERNGLGFVDFNKLEHRDRIGHLEFYADGQHLLQQSACRVSLYIASLILRNLEN